MNHSFNTEIATKYGVTEAIVIENLYFWILKNKANNTHFYDGYYWTYNSTRAFKTLFPYWSERQIDRILKSLKDQGAILIGNYNKVGYDRTRWFTLSMAVSAIIPFGGMDLPKRLNGFTEKVGPIPDINTDINSNINKDKVIAKHTKKVIVKIKLDIDKTINDYTDNIDLRESLNDFIVMRKTKGDITDRGFELILKKLTKISKNDDEKIEILSNSIIGSYKGVFPIKGDNNYDGNRTNTTSGEGKRKWAGYKVPVVERKPLTDQQIADLDLI